MPPSTVLTSTRELRTSAATLVWSSAAIVALSLIVGLPTVRSDNYFLGDDFGLVQHLHDVPFQRLLSYFVSDWTEGIYGGPLDELRPFLAFSYWLDAHLFGVVNATGYHATNVILHTLNALLVLTIARAVAPGQVGFPVLAAALFTVMPSHAEPISWISGRVDSLTGLCYLGAFLCFVRFRRRQRISWLLATLIVFLCGLFTKQSVVTFPILILAFDLLAPDHNGSTGSRVFSRVSTHLPFFVVLAAYLALRYQLFGNAVREDALDASVVLEFAFRQLFYAVNLLPTATRFPLAAVVVTLSVLAVCASWLLDRREGRRPAIWRVVFFGVLWYAITIVPMVVTYPSARHLYLTSAGLSIALASLMLPGWPGEERRRKAARLVMAAIVVSLCATALLERNQQWIRDGIESHTFVAAMPRMLETVSRGSVVVVGIPAKHGNRSLWSWALPFALQKPFVAENLYDQFVFLEYPRVYCCPDQWWAAKEAAFMALINAPTQVTYIGPATHEAGGLVLTTRTIGGAELRRRIEDDIGRPVESLSSKVTYQEAHTLATILMK